MSGRMTDPDPALTDAETDALQHEYVELIFFGGPEGRPRMEEIDRILTVSAQARHQEAEHQDWQTVTWMIRKVRREVRKNTM